MVNPKIVEETPIGLSDIKIEIDKIKKRDKELGARSSRMEDYLNQFTTLSTEENKKLVDELTKLDIPRLRGTHIIKIADLIPETVDDIKVILQGYALTVTTDNMKKIVGVTSKFASK
ncbi:hypothetical protein KY313_02715 [Candidatus Woesearchaeota archaeon]|jgi:DNA-directed RNA polymerase subunit F|nr:hypothetical protein [Candidatus Woesearchaeota archaeon]